MNIILYLINIRLKKNIGKSSPIQWDEVLGNKI